MAVSVTNLPSNLSEDISNSSVIVGDSNSNHNKALTIIKNIELYCSLTLGPLGFILNVAAFVVFVKMKGIQKSSSLYFKCLAIADNFAILGVFSHINTNNNYTPVPDISVVHPAFCKFFAFSIISGLNASGFILACATVERFICIAFPLKVKTWNLYLVSILCVTMSVTISVSSGILQAYSMTVLELATGPSCVGVPERAHLAKNNTQSIWLATLSTPL